MTRLFFVIDVDHDFKADMAEAATWMEDCLDAGTTFATKVVAYRSLNDMTFDADDKVGVFKDIREQSAEEIVGHVLKQWKGSDR